MDPDHEWMRDLIGRSADAAAPVDVHDIAKIRLYFCLASDRQVAEIIQLSRGSRETVFDNTSSRKDPEKDPEVKQLNNDGDEASIIDRLPPTKPTRPGTAAGVLELVRRGPNLFQQLPIAYQLEALRSVVIRRNHEQDELSRTVALAAVKSFAELRGEESNGIVPQPRVEEVLLPRLDSWVDGQVTELGFPSIGIDDFVESLLDPDVQEREYDFRELLVDQKFSVPELQEMHRALLQRLTVRVAEFQRHFDSLPPQTSEMERLYLRNKLIAARKELNVSATELDLEAYHDTLNRCLLSIADMEDLNADFESRQGDEGFPLAVEQRGVKMDERWGSAHADSACDSGGTDLHRASEFRP